MFEAYIGNPYSIARVDEEMNLEKSNSVFYPVISNNNIAALIVAHKNEDVISFSCGAYYAESLNANMPIHEDFVLLLDEYGSIYSISKNNETTVVFENEMTIDITLSFSEVSDYTVVVSDESLRENNGKLVNWYNPSRLVREVKLADYPCFVQTGNTCWANAIYSMANYKLGITPREQVFAAFQIANGYGPDSNGASTSEAYNTIVYLFNRYAPGQYSPVRTGAQLSSEQISKNINADLPVYIRGSRTDGGTTGHAVALMGYELDTNYLIPGNVSGIYVMNSQAGAIEYNPYSPTNCYFYSSSGDIQYIWNDSITLMGTL